MINIKPIENVELYTYGSWTSQALYNSHAGFPTGVTSEWGYLIWEEENTGTGYTGYVRLDLINADTSAVILSNIAKNTDGSPSDISTYASTYNIKIRVNLYGLDSPTPVVKNIRLKFKNWNVEQVIANGGKNLLLNRSLLTPSSTAIYDVSIGNSQSTAFAESSTSQSNILATQLLDDTFSTLTHTEDEQLVESTFELNNSDIIITNGTTLNSIGYRNNDATKVFIGGARYADIVKNIMYTYSYKVAFKVYSKSATDSVFTKRGENIVLHRLFNNSPTYTGLKYGVSGMETTLSNEMTSLTTTNFGPDEFQYATVDTSKIKATFSMLMDQTEGNLYNHDSIGLLNNDATNNFMYAAFIGETISKTSTYIYTFNTTWFILTPISSLI